MKTTSVIKRVCLSLGTCALMSCASGGGNAEGENPFDLSDSDRELSVETCDATSTDETCFAWQAMNQERAERNRGVLNINVALQEAAQAHAEELAERSIVTHDSLDGRTFVDRANEAGYVGTIASENVAGGVNSGSDVVALWMSSDGHRANILAERTNEVGIGVASGMWVAKFGTR